MVVLVLIGSGLVAAVLLCIKREGISNYHNILLHDLNLIGSKLFTQVLAITDRDDETATSNWGGCNNM